MKISFPSGRTLEIKDGIVDVVTWRTPHTMFHPSDIVLPRPDPTDYCHTLEVEKDGNKFVSRHGSMEEAELAAVALLYFLGAAPPQPE